MNKASSGFMGTFINVFHVSSDGEITELKTKEDAERALKEEKESE